MDAHTRCSRSRLERNRELVVGEVTAEAQTKRLALRLRELAKRLLEPFEPRLVRLRGCRLAIEALAEPEPLACRTLQPAPSNTCREDVLRDAEEPGRCRSTCLVSESRSREPGLREGLGGQVVRCVGVAAPAEMKAVDALGIAVVEGPERMCIGAGRREQRCIGRHESWCDVIATSEDGYLGRWLEVPRALRRTSHSRLASPRA